MQHTETIAIDTPMAAVWELVGDPLNWPKWMPELTDVKVDGELAAGSLVSYTWKGSKRLTTITRYLPNQEITIRGEEPNYIHTQNIRVRGSGEMSTVALTMSFESKVWWATALTPFFIAIKRIGMGMPMRKDLKRLKRTTEQAGKRVAA